MHRNQGVNRSSIPYFFARLNKIDQYPQEFLITALSAASQRHPQSPTTSSGALESSRDMRGRSWDVSDTADGAF